MSFFYHKETAFSVRAQELNFWKCYGKSKNKFSIPLSYWRSKRFALMRGFQIWSSQNWAWIIYDPYFGRKKTSKYTKIAISMFFFGLVQRFSTANMGSHTWPRSHLISRNLMPQPQWHPELSVKSADFLSPESTRPRSSYSQDTCPTLLTVATSGYRHGRQWVPIAAFVVRRDVRWCPEINCECSL